MTKMKKLLISTLTAILVVMMTIGSASACTSIYVGSGLTEDGGVYFARSEDISNSYNKVFYVSPAGNHKAGDAYTGCYGFTYTFTHDSYGYTAFSDDNLQGVQGVCPDCKDDHAHTPYEAAGTNDKGVTITATVTLSCNDAMKEADPKVKTGIEEAEIPTVILSEAATAKEGVDLLLSIYDSVGAHGGSGIFIADQKEVWYVENCSGTQYIALKLSPDLVFISPNMSAIGAIDLDDENVIASANLIATAQTAGTFVGDADENIIDYRASYAAASINDRMINGLNYLTGTGDFTHENTTSDAFTITNVKDGAIVPFYTNIALAHTMATKDMVDFYKVDGIGNTSNLDYHLFQVYADGAAEKATVEWVGMDHGAYGVMVPYYPMLTTDTYAGYQVSTAKAEFVTEQPDGSTPYYAATSRGTEGFKVLPEGWEQSYYWTFDALSNYLLAVDNAKEQDVKDAFAELQASIYESFDAMKAEVAASDDLTALAASMTAASSDLAAKAHAKALELYNMVSAAE